MGCVSYAEQAAAVPAFEVVELHGQEFDLVPGGKFVDAIGEKRGKACDGGVEGGKAGWLDGGEGVLGDDEAALEVVGAVDEDEAGAEVEVERCVVGVGVPATKAKPENVDGSATVDDVQVSGGAAEGVAPVTADGEGGVDFDEAAGCVGADPGDDGALARDGRFEEAGHFVLEEKMERGQGGGMRCEEVEEVPLGHESDKGCGGFEVGEVCEGELGAADEEAEAVDLLMGDAQELVEEAKLVEDVEGRGVDSIATEVAEEVLVLFEDGDVDSDAGEEEAEDDAGGASADDAAGRAKRLRGARHRSGSGFR